jgi:hypothetical protein
VERVLEIEEVEEPEDHKELPEEYPIGDLAEEPHDPVAQHRGQAGRGPVLEGRGRDHRHCDDRIEGGLDLGLPQAGDVETLWSGQRRAGEGEGEHRDQPAGHP